MLNIFIKKKKFGNFQTKFSAGEELIDAVRVGSVDRVSGLVRVGQLDVNYRRLGSGQTPLMYTQCPTIAKLLLRHGAGITRINWKIFELFFRNF